MKTVLFDLDGTLLPMEQDPFIKAYFGGLVTKMLPYGYDPNLLIKAIWTGTGAMVANDGSQSNEDAFWAAAATVLGEDCRKDEPIFADFYKKEFQFVSTSCGYTPEAAKHIAWLKDQGCRLVLATNPIFPAIATQRRMGWAGLKESDFELVTTYENSRHCKPNLDYYRDILKTIDETADNCIMVGNDVTEDMVAKELGMVVFLLTDHMINKQQLDISQFDQGSFAELKEFLMQRI